MMPLDSECLLSKRKKLMQIQSRMLRTVPPIIKTYIEALRADKKLEFEINPNDAIASLL